MTIRIYIAFTMQFNSQTKTKILQGNYLNQSQSAQTGACKHYGHIICLTSLYIANYKTNIEKLQNV